MSAEDYLHTTPPEINWKLEAHNRAQDERTTLFWQLGQWIGIAYHKPSEYPALSKFLHNAPPAKREFPATDKEAREDLMSLQP
jgi:hypothetical protein